MKDEFDTNEEVLSGFDQATELWWQAEKKMQTIDMTEAYLELLESDNQWLLWASSDKIELQRKAFSLYLTMMPMILLDTYNLGTRLGISEIEISDESNRRFNEVHRDIGEIMSRGAK